MLGMRAWADLDTAQFEHNVILCSTAASLAQAYNIYTCKLVLMEPCIAILPSCFISCSAPCWVGLAQAVFRAQLYCEIRIEPYLIRPLLFLLVKQNAHHAKRCPCNAVLIIQRPSHKVIKLMSYYGYTVHVVTKGFSRSDPHYPACCDLSFYHICVWGHSAHSQPMLLCVCHYEPWVCWTLWTTW